MTVGGYNTTYHENEVEWVPLIPNYHHYGIELKSIQVGTTLLNITDYNKMGKSIVDSGTTFTYLEGDMYRQFWSTFKEICEDEDKCVASLRRDSGHSEP